MASFPKHLAPPPLQLLVLMLFLGAGLLANNSLADDQAGAADPAAPPTTDDAGAIAGTTTHSPANASGRAGKPTINCWEQDCNSDAPNFNLSSPDHCLKKPGEAGALKVACSTGYCFQSIMYGTTETEGKKFAEVIRACAPPWAVTCQTVNPGSCLHINLTGKYDLKTDFEEYATCAFDSDADAEDPKLPSRVINRKSRGSSGKAAICVCQRDLCNDRTSSGPPGVKQLGYNAALVGALLVAVFHIQRMFLVG